MDNFELIDDYLANRLQEQDRKTFEQQLEGDPSLKEELEFQKHIVEGVKQARIVELKSMLNNVPVGGGSWSGGKIAAGVVTVGIVATGLYFYFNTDEAIVNATEETKQEIIQPGSGQEKDKNQEVVPTDETTKDAIAETGNSARETSKDTKTKVIKPVQKPDIQVVDPSEELTEEKSTEVNPGRSEISTSKMEVITESADKKHDFHYQFVQGKLLLFGPFDKNLYEVLEIHGEGHAVFLFYRENYYMLDERQDKITKLSAIQDTELLKKLKEYRGR